MNINVAIFISFTIDSLESRRRIDSGKLKFNLFVMYDFFSSLVFQRSFSCASYFSIYYEQRQNSPKIRFNYGKC